MKKNLFTGPAFRYLIAGACAYAIELAALLFLYRFLHFSVEAATAVAFWVGLPASFLLQKLLAFQDYQKELQVISKQLIIYSVLVGFNYIFTLAVVALLPEKWIIFSRTLALVIVTIWNYALYHYIFTDKPAPTRADVTAWFKRAVTLKNRRVNIVLLALPIIAFCVPLLLTGSKIAPGDPDYYFQMLEAFRRSVLDFGQFPMWNPWLSGGIPLFGDPQVGIVSLQAPLVLAFGTVMGMKIAIVGYLLIGFYGFRKLFMGSFGASSLRGSLLAYLPIFSTYMVFRVNGGHFTFLLLAFTPWVLHFFLQRYKKLNWLWFALVYSFMVWSAPHYTTIMTATVVLFWYLFELAGRTITAARTNNWQTLRTQFLADLAFFAKAGTLVVALCAYRLFFVYDFIKDFPRLTQAVLERFTDPLHIFFAMWSPTQYQWTPELRSHYGWIEAASYIGIGTLVCIMLIGGVIIASKMSKRKAKESSFRYPIILLVALFILFFALALGNFGSWSPYALLSNLPVFNSMRVATRWIMWCSIIILVVIATYRGQRFKRTINIILIFTVAELFITGIQSFGRTYVVELQQYNYKGVTQFTQEYKYRVPRPQYAGDAAFLAAYPYDMNLTETTMNNLGQVIADDSLVDTRQPHSTNRCGANQGNCPFISDNAEITSWMPNKITIKRLTPGPIYLNMNPGRGWKVNGVYAFATYKVTDPLAQFVIQDKAYAITLEYAPVLSPAWVFGGY